MSAIPWQTVEDALQAWIVAGSGLASDHVTWGGQTAPRPTGAFISMRRDGITGSDWDWNDRLDNILTVATTAITSVNTGTGVLTIPGHGLQTGDGALVFTTTGTVPGGLALLTHYYAVVVDANNIKVATSFQLAIATSPTTVTLTSSGTGTTSINGTPTTVRAGQEVTQYTRGPRQMELHLECFAGAPTGGAPTGSTSPFAILHDAVTSHALEAINAALVAAGIGVAGWDPIKTIDGVVNTVRFEPRAQTTVHLHLASELVQASTFIQVVNVTENIPTPPAVTTITLPE